MLGKIEGRRIGDDRIRLVGWHHWLNGNKLGQTLEDTERQGSLVCCSSWGHKE